MGWVLVAEVYQVKSLAFPQIPQPVKASLFSTYTWNLQPP
jgi:hypothetical protein